MPGFMRRRKRDRNHTRMTMARGSMQQNTPQASRIDWVDVAKGFCIVMVVMMHSTLGVEKAAGETASCITWSSSPSPSGCRTSS